LLVNLFESCDDARTYEHHIYNLSQVVILFTRHEHTLQFLIIYF